MADTDYLANSIAVLGLMTSADEATHKMRTNTIDEIAQLASVSLLTKGAINMTAWEELKQQLESLKSQSLAATTALAQAAEIKANSPPIEELIKTKTELQSMASGLAAAVAQFTVAASAPPKSPGSGD